MGGSTSSSPRGAIHGGSQAGCPWHLYSLDGTSHTALVPELCDSWCVDMQGHFRPEMTSKQGTRSSNSGVPLGGFSTSEEGPQIPPKWNLDSKSVIVDYVLIFFESPAIRSCFLFFWQVLHLLGEMQRLTLRAPDVAGRQVDWRYWRSGPHSTSR